MYSRQKLIPQIGEEGQLKLKKGRVAVIGAGGLGGPAALYLSYGGVGHIRIIDNDTVAPSNLNRQILYGVADLGRSKALCAQERLAAAHPEEEIEGITATIDENSVRQLIGDVQAVVACVDNQHTRRCLNRACQDLGIPLVEGGIHGFYGYVMTIGKDTPCMECLGSQAEEKDAPIPSLGAVAGVIGSLQAVECIKLLTGAGKPLYGRLLTYDGLDGSFDCLPVEKSPSCPIHGSLSRT
ncbi:MAG: HesA/MoeB/ThiF family protein [Eubacteriales bacterium]|nr:HesA/MoeB/ThiF family protein [Eubacteriales bacterium]